MQRLDGVRLRYRRQVHARVRLAQEARVPRELLLLVLAELQSNGAATRSKQAQPSLGFQRVHGESIAGKASACGGEADPFPPGRRSPAAIPLPRRSVSRYPRGMRPAAALNIKRTASGDAHNYARDPSLVLTQRVVSGNCCPRYDSFPRFAKFVSLFVSLTECLFLRYGSLAKGLPTAASPRLSAIQTEGLRKVFLRG